MTEPLHGRKPPPIPRETPAAAPPKKGLSTTAIVLIVCAGLGVLCIPGLIGAVVVVVPQMQEKQKRLTCQQNLSQLAALFAQQEQERPGAPRRSGTALFLGWRADQSVLRSGTESVLVCPGDPQAQDPVRGFAAWDHARLDPPDRTLCSYAARDFAAFPLPKSRTQDEPIAACIHHNGVNIAFDSGRVRFHDWAELGVSDGTQVTIGPDSEVPMLQRLCYRPGITER